MPCNQLTTGYRQLPIATYSQSLDKFTQPDTIIPDLTNTQSWNRYSYVNNSPILYNDPSGHRYCDMDSNGECEDHGDNGLLGSDWDWDPRTPYYGGGGKRTDHSLPPSEYFFEDANVSLSPEELEELRSDIIEKIDFLDGITDIEAGIGIGTTFADSLGLIGEALSIDPRMLFIQVFIWNATNNGLDDLRDFTIALDDYRGSEVTIELGHNFREWGILVNGDKIIERTYDKVPLIGLDEALDSFNGFENVNNIFLPVMKYFILNKYED